MHDSPHTQKNGFSTSFKARYAVFSTVGRVYYKIKNRCEHIAVLWYNFSLNFEITDYILFS